MSGRRINTTSHRNWIVSIFVLLAVFVLFTSVANHLSSASSTTYNTTAANKTSSKDAKAHSLSDSGGTSNVSNTIPTKGLSDSAANTVQSQIGAKLTYVNGSYIIGNDIPVFDKRIPDTVGINAATLNSAGQLSSASALLNSTIYDKTPRSGKVTYKPAGWQQRVVPGNIFGGYLYNRGHLIGYAFVGNLKGFDASENNRTNIMAETSWANQAQGGAQGNGQNYFEGLVRNAVEKGETVKYEVKPLYVGSDKVPSAIEIEAQGSTVRFRALVPNVQPGVNINYATGLASN